MPLYRIGHFLNFLTDLPLLQMFGLLLVLDVLTIFDDGLIKLH